MNLFCHRNQRFSIPKDFCSRMFLRCSHKSSCNQNGLVRKLRCSRIFPPSSIGVFFYPSTFPLYCHFSNEEEREERGRRKASLSHLSSLISFKKEGKREKMNCMGTKMRGIWEKKGDFFLFQKKEKRKDKIKRIQKRPHSSEDEQGLFIFYSNFSSFLSMRKRIKKFTFGRIEGK